MRRLAGIVRIWVDRRCGVQPPGERELGRLAGAGRAMRGQQVAVEAKERQRDTRRLEGLTRAGEGRRGAKSQLDSNLPARCGAGAVVGRWGGEPKYLGHSVTKKRSGSVFQLGPRRHPSPTPDSRTGAQQQSSTHPIRSAPGSLAVAAPARGPGQS